MTTTEQIVSTALWIVTAVASTIALAVLVRWWLGSPTRDRQDDERLLGAFLNAWDLSAKELGDLTGLTGLRIGRLYCAIARLEGLRILDSYWQGESPSPRGEKTLPRLADDRHRDEAARPRIRRYALTNLGREEAYEMERRKIDLQ